MLTSISPLGERARGNRWWLTVGWLSLGAVVGGAVVGVALGAAGQFLAGSLSDGARLAVLAGACAAAAAWDMSGRGLPGRRQVNEDWLVAYRSWVYGAGFGLQLGAAVATVVNTALVPLFMLAALLAGDITAGLAIGAAFGAARGASMAAEQPGAHHRRSATGCTAVSTSTPTGLAVWEREPRPGSAARPPRACWRCDRIESVT